MALLLALLFLVFLLLEHFLPYLCPVRHLCAYFRKILWLQYALEYVLGIADRYLRYVKQHGLQLSGLERYLSLWSEDLQTNWRIVECDVNQCRYRLYKHSDYRACYENALFLQWLVNGPVAVDDAYLF